mmetsp:Transcript_19001/g.13796  ORF Transcript_19001/g.13796 Transcript_19001/m.13796 type:complete len:135 (+) Transcript_19001:1375-1779(+)|eukprot:CAMPEP_0202958326 /NCGR_PEP_ID=MMETSP1396-20130829/2686_1 /ASSEMBLY_ACC=CAM_ASM_000872 /TAXON_ID= /ORGANISM="Pseudokeronopsis sp., Strain Brazil" /LENGTH=134 /DNA_ID=CAMNT_0049676347 /DNA_START=1355 /DNA_END=1759 /DNA_ORIENTATION=+
MVREFRVVKKVLLKLDEQFLLKLQKDYVIDSGASAGEEEHVQVQNGMINYQSMRNPLTGMYEIYKIKERLERILASKQNDSRLKMLVDGVIHKGQKEDLAIVKDKPPAEKVNEDVSKVEKFEPYSMRDNSHRML